MNAPKKTGKLIADGWNEYVYAVLPADCSRTQIEESKKCFYAGASQILSSILAILEPGSEPTEKDMVVVDSIVPVQLRSGFSVLEAARSSCF